MNIDLITHISSATSCRCGIASDSHRRTIRGSIPAGANITSPSTSVGQVPVGVGNIVGSPLVGWTPLPSPAVSYNVISGNTGPGVTLEPGTNYNAVINNYIGLNILAQPVLPNGGGAIQNDGGANLIYGNGAHGPLPWQSPTGQLEALFIGWFGRAADPVGFKQDMEEVLSLMLGGDTIAAAMLKASDGFASSPAIGIYAPLATLTTPVTSPTLEQVALANGFINQTFTNLFGRTATHSEQTIWREAFFDGAIPFSDLVYDIASSAQNNDVVAMNATSPPSRPNPLSM